MDLLVSVKISKAGESFTAFMTNKGFAISMDHPASLQSIYQEGC